MRTASVFVLAMLAGASPASAQTEITYQGLCEASAAAALDADHFAVASDETNVIKIYRRGTPDPVGSLEGVQSFSTFDKSDLEGAARVGGWIYWISSHSYNKEGKDRPKRKLFFATEIKARATGPALDLVGKARTDLGGPIAKAASVQVADLNIEGLAVTEDNALLIGLRSPLHGQAATVLRLDNPNEVVTAGAAPRFGPPMRLDLAGRGIRSLERIDGRFYILGGPVTDGGQGFALYSWSGRSDDLKPQELTDIDLGGLFPEALIGMPGPEFLVLSDEGDYLRPDGTTCDDEKPSTRPAFRARSIAAPRPK